MNIFSPIVWTLTISVIIHGIFLATSFYDIPKRISAKKTMEIILVNSKTAQAPINTQVFAQANLNGGGSVEENLRIKTPFPVDENNKTENTNINLQISKNTSQADEQQQQQLETQIKNLEQEQQKLYSEVQHKSKTIKRKRKQDKNKITNNLANLSAAEMLMATRETMNLEGEISERIQKYNQRPRRKFIGATTKEVNYAAYLEAWRQKIERLGTINYPNNARGKIYGSLMLSVAIRKNGSIEKVKVLRSSGHKILDEAALRIIKLGEPYARFPPDIAAETDIIEVNRWWKFTKDEEFR